MKIQSILETLKEKYLGKEIELFKNKGSEGYYISNSKGIFESEHILLTVTNVEITYSEENVEYYLTVNFENENWYISLYNE